MSNFLFLGDSITDAGHLFDPANLGDGYVSMLAVDMRFFNCVFQNRGHDGFTTEQVFPYIVVRISEGRVEQPGENQAVNILLNFGVYDPDRRNSGYLDVLHMIETIRQRFFKNPILNHKYECTAQMEWALQDEESYPYNFGSLSLNFLTAPMQREDENA